MQVEEQVIMTIVWKHPIALLDETKLYAETTSSIFFFFIAENEWMMKELQKSKKGGDLVNESAWVELKKAILDEVFSLDTMMQALYSKFCTMKKEVVHLNEWQ